MKRIPFFQAGFAGRSEAYKGHLNPWIPKLLIVLIVEMEEEARELIKSIGYGNMELPEIHEEVSKLVRKGKKDTISREWFEVWQQIEQSKRCDSHSYGKLCDITDVLLVMAGDKARSIIINEIARYRDQITSSRKALEHKQWVSNSLDKLTMMYDDLEFNNTQLKSMTMAIDNNMKLLESMAPESKNTAMGVIEELGSAVGRYWKKINHLKIEIAKLEELRESGWNRDE